MRTQSKIWLSTAVSFAVSGVLAFLVISSVRGMGDDLSRGRDYSDVIQKAYAMNLLVATFVHESSPRQLQQFEQVHSSLTDLLNGLKSSDVREESLIQKIRRNNIELDPLLQQFLSRGNEPETLDAELKKMLAAQIWNKVRFVTDDTTRLKELSESRIVSNYTRIGATVLFLLMVLLAANVIISFVSGHGILRAERALREANERYELVLKGSEAGIWDWDVLRHTVMRSPRWKALRGFAGHEISDSEEEWIRRIHPDDAPRVMAAVQAHFEGKTAVFAEEYRVSRKDGSWMWIADRGLAARDDEGRVVRMAGSETDVTERRRIEDELRKSRDELELRVQERTAELETYMRRLRESNQALQEFAFIASHDLQEPLRKVVSFGGILKRKYGDAVGETGADYLDRMLKATARMQTLLNSLLEYSRVSTGADPFREVDLNVVIQEVVSDLEVRIARTGGQVEVGRLPVISAEPTQMRQIFQNLIGNALKFHKEGEKPLVKVHCTGREGEPLQIRVEDNGIGFDEKHLQAVFAPFQRLHGRSSRYEGVGMGLAICKKIVDRHGGEITARSEVGKGSAFIVTLPSSSRI